jgi:palmitoyltransferase
MALVYYFTLFVVLDHWLGLATPAGAAHAAAISLANRVLRHLRVRCSC